MKKVAKFLQLPQHDRRLLLGSVFLVGLIRIGLWLIPFKSFWGLISKKTQNSIDLPCGEPAELSRVVWAVKTASRLIPKATCLVQALAAQVLLNRRGHPTRLRIGVAKSEEGQLLAHAWVENQGSVVIGDFVDLPRYSPLPPLPVEEEKR